MDNLHDGKPHLFKIKQRCTASCGWTYSLVTKKPENHTYEKCPNCGANALLTMDDLGEKSDKPSRGSIP